jgi:hypothetical protein
MSLCAAGHNTSDPVMKQPGQHQSYTKDFRILLVAYATAWAHLAAVARTSPTTTCTLIALCSHVGAKLGAMDGLLWQVKWWQLVSVGHASTCL